MIGFILNYIGNRFNEILTNNKSSIALIGYVGSLSPTKISSDIDLFCFLNEKHTDALNSFSKHKELITTIRIIQNELFIKKINLSVFTEFRLEEYFRYLSYKKDCYDNYLLHLKVYPSPESVINWQQRTIAYNYFENVSKIIYKSVDETRIIAFLKNNIPKPIITEKIEFLRMLVYELNEYLLLGNLPSKLVNIELKNKSLYISSYLNDCLFEYKDSLIKIANIPKKKKIIILKEKIEKIKDILNSSTNNLNINTLNNIFDSLFLIVEEAYIELTRI